MQEYLANFRKYLSDYLNHNYDDIRQASLEYRPRNGYGDFYRSDEVYSLLFNINAHLRDSLLSTKIPESYPTPKALIKFVRNFRDYLKSHDELFADIYQDQELVERISMVVHRTNEIRIDLIQVLNHILEMDEVNEYNSDSTTEQHANIPLDKKSKKGHGIETKKTSSVESVLAAYDLEDIKIFEWLKILNGMQLFKLIAFLIGIFFAGYETGTLFEENKSTLQSFEDKQTIQFLQDSLNHINQNIISESEADTLVTPER